MQQDRGFAFIYNARRSGTREAHDEFPPRRGFRLCPATRLPAMDPEAANLCAEHCKQGRQGDQASTLTVPAALLKALYAIAPSLPGTAPPRPAAAPLSALVAASPPHAILHCVYRI